MAHRRRHHTTAVAFDVTFEIFLALVTVVPTSTFNDSASSFLISCFLDCCILYTAAIIFDATFEFFSASCHCRAHLCMPPPSMLLRVLSFFTSAFPDSFQCEVVIVMNVHGGCVGGIGLGLVAVVVDSGGGFSWLRLGAEGIVLTHSLEAGTFVIVVESPYPSQAVSERLEKKMSCHLGGTSAHPWHTSCEVLIPRWIRVNPRYWSELESGAGMAVESAI
ncbi:hypothetical protein PIB30_018150 [Stylosanthes scabra]|uniref:Uncharacterized protein n=1 Tax=Stylosanthes scabra TaxID=79078 RepID=A0ABU6Q7T2_9FABA|nr:hypothetical protein [Stylosanthes scabra]